MKKLFSMTLIALLVTACNSSKPENTNDEDDMAAELDAPSQTFAAVMNSAQDEDCEGFKLLFTDDVTVTDEDCSAAFTWINEEDPELDWDNVEWNGTQSKVKVYQSNGRVFGSFEQDDTGNFLVDTKFWE